MQTRNLGYWIVAYVYLMHAGLGNYRHLELYLPETGQTMSRIEVGVTMDIRNMM